MGHQLLSDPPTTEEWLNVVNRINHGGNARTVADASVRVIKEALMGACNDPGLIEVVYLLCNVPQAARNPSFAEALLEYGVCVSADPSLKELLMALSERMDDRFSNNPFRTDLNEMAQAVLVESISSMVESKLHESFFHTHAEQVQDVLANCHMRKDFGQLAKRFFGRFMFKCIDYFLGRTLTQMVGDGKRFESLQAYRTYMIGLEMHCVKAAAVLIKFSIQWVQKEYRLEGSISYEGVNKFLYGAMSKLVNTLTQTEIRRAS